MTMSDALRPLLLLLLVSLLWAGVFATPGNVYISGKCIDCNKPELPDEANHSAGVSQTLTIGAVGFALLYSFLGSLLRNAAH